MFILILTITLESSTPNSNPGYCGGCFLIIPLKREALFYFGITLCFWLFSWGCLISNICWWELQCSWAINKTLGLFLFLSFLCVFIFLVLFLFFVCLFVFLDRVSLYSNGCPETHCVDQVGLRLKNPPDSASPVLGLQACTTTVWLKLSFLKIHLLCYPLLGQIDMASLPSVMV